MLADAANPPVFRDVGKFGEDSEVMVSIAPSRAGFPLHSHGRYVTPQARPSRTARLTF